MSAAVQTPVVHPETIHNSRELLVVVFVLALASWFIAGCSVCMVIYLLTNIKAAKVAAGLGAIEWGLSAWCFVLTALFLWRQSIKKWNARVVLDATGVNFHYRDGKAYTDFRMEWAKIDKVLHRRAPTMNVYTVHGSDGGSFAFNNYTYMRPKKIATRVAAVVGKSIQEEK